MQNPSSMYGIIGYPLGQTMSPTVHNWGFQRQNINAAYFAWPVEPEKIQDFFTALHVLNIQGLSVTIPHKQAVMSFLDGISDDARRVGAVNTLYWKDGKLLGENTDVLGFCAPIKNMKLHSALVLGAGGAARAVLAGLAAAGVKLYLSARRPLVAKELAAEFGATVIDWKSKKAFFQHIAENHSKKNLVVNTTPLGMKGKAEGENPLSKDDLEAVSKPDNVIFYDIVYNPLETEFLKAAKSLGCETIDGLIMFAAQAQAQFQIWTGTTLPLDEIKALLLKHLQE